MGSDVVGISAAQLLSDKPAIGIELNRFAVMVFD
jgi:hypothetical protein